MNNHELESTLSMFAEDASLNFGPLGTIVGAAQIRGIHEYDVALETRVIFEDCQAKDQEVSCRAIETNEWLNQVDVDSIIFDETLFVFNSDRRIESISSTLSPESIEVMGAAIADFDAWARSNRADEYSTLFSVDGEFLYNYQNGMKVLGLLRQWRAESG